MNFCILLFLCLSVSCLCLFNLFALLCHFIYIFFYSTLWRIVFCYRSRAVSLSPSLSNTLSHSILRKCPASPASLACATHLDGAGYRQCELLVLYLKVDFAYCFRLLFFIISAGNLALVDITFGVFFYFIFYLLQYLEKFFSFSCAQLDWFCFWQLSH